jgi:hypothetical protein
MKSRQNVRAEEGGLGGLHGFVLSRSLSPSPRPSPRGEGEFSPVGQRIATLGGYASRAQRFPEGEGNGEGERDGRICLSFANPAKGHNVLSEGANSVRSDLFIASTPRKFFLFFSGAAYDDPSCPTARRAAEKQDNFLWAWWSINRPPLTGFGTARAGLRFEQGEGGWAREIAGDSGVVPSFLEAGR